MSKRARGSRGQATVEMALVLPILLLLIVGLVDAARMAGALLSVQHAAREAVRLGITGAPDAAVEERAFEAASILEPERLTVTVSPPGPRPPGSDITVTVRYRYSFLVLFNLAGTDVDIESRLTGRVE